MSSSSPIPETGTARSDSAASARDSATLLAELASQAIVLLQRADPHTVVTGLLKEKSYLHTQNGQLWRLVDKQRAALLDLQKDHQKVLGDKNKYQARLKALQQRQDGIRPFDQNSNSTESSSLAIQDLDASQEVSKPPSRRSSARSIKSRPPRSPQPNAQLDALQASLEAEIAKSSDDTDSGSSGLESNSSQKSKETTIAPIVINSPSTNLLSSRGKKVPTPLDLSPAKIRVVDAMPRSAYLIPRSETPESHSRSTARDPPPSAPPYQTSNSNYLTATTRVTPPLRSPGLPKSPRPIATQQVPLPLRVDDTPLRVDDTPLRVDDTPLRVYDIPLRVDDTVYDETEQPSQETAASSSIQTLKSPTETEETSDYSSSPTSVGPTSPQERDVLVETARKSPLVPRRSRMPSHRANTSLSHTSTSSSIITISGPTPTSASAPVAARSSRSFSLENAQPSVRSQDTLVPPEQSVERRRSRSFDDLQSLVHDLRSESSSPMVKSKSSNASLTGVGLDEAILDIQREDALYSQKTLEPSELMDTKTSPQRSSPAEAPPAEPTAALQPPFTARSRASSNVAPPVKLMISPNDIPSVVLSVLSVRSRQKASAPNSGEETLFTIRCRLRNPTDKSLEREILRVEKTFSALTDLGSSLSSIVGMAQFLNSFFDDFPIEKADQRKAVDYFFGVVMGSQLDDRSLYAIAQFLSTDIVQKHDSKLLDNRSGGLPDSTGSMKSPTRIEIPAGGFRDGTGPTKEGYLTKRGKNFGGWQTRYFVLDGPQLKYYDAPNGVHLGSIKVPQAQIGRQNSQAQAEVDENGDEQMRYAFLILEPKRNDASKTVRHVLCSHTDEDRDEWINALLHYVAMDPEPSSATSEKGPRGKRLQRRQDHEASTESNVAANTAHPVSSEPLTNETEIIAIRYDQMPAGKRPVTSTEEVRRQTSWPQPSQDEPRIADRLTRSPEQLRQAPPSVPSRSPYRGTISAPINGAPITDETAWNTAQREEERRREEKRAKKRSVWGFLSKENRGRSTPESIQATAPPPPALMQHGLFGISLREAVDITREMGMGINVPSVVYRCIEYLEHMDAAKEEGIYRLSGSNSAIRLLKDRFNSEGDVDFVNSKDYHDVHAVAGLLKLYLRELPSTVLTRERHVDFLHIVDIEDKSARVRRLGELVHTLPKVNYELLRVMSKHLKRIVACSQENKMTIRNVGIVFSPTLNIPAPVFSLFITEYEVVFDEPDSTPDTNTPPAASDPPPSYPYTDNQTALSHSNNHLTVQDHPSHRRKHSNEPSGRPSTSQGRPSTSQGPPPSFPLHTQGYREGAYQQQPYQQQIYPQESYYQQSYQHYPALQPTYQRQRTHDDDDSNLFG